MVLTLGKRKRVSKAVASLPAPPVKKVEVESEESDKEDLQAAFRRAFEAKFKPLPDTQKKAKKEPEIQVEEDAQSEESDWSGISEPEDAVEVVEHMAIQAHDNRADKAALKAFMSSKPPSDPNATTTDQNKKRKTDDAEEGDDDNLKNDLALQRLLKESHLLEGSFSSTDPSGKNRHKATDMRLLDLGGKSSIFTQKTMPMSHRKGIMQKAQQKEESRRSEAKENGIILERAQFNKSKGPAERRERSVGGPQVGKFRGGTLTLSKHDIAGITGPKQTATRGGKRGGRGGGRGGRGGRGGGGGKR